MNPPPELVTVGQFGPLWGALCLAWTAALLIACGLGIPRRRGGRLLSGCLALLGPLGWGLWVLYRARVAYDPASGIAGLHRVPVLLTNLLLFVVVGAVIGAALGWLVRRLGPKAAAGAGASGNAANKG
jgi:hypothetical protein